MDYEKSSVAELRQLAKDRGIKGTSALKKQELIDLLTGSAKPAEESAAKAEAKPAEKAETKPVQKTEAEPAEKAEAKPAAKPAAKAAKSAKPAGGSEAKAEAKPVQKADAGSSAGSTQGSESKPAARPAQSSEARPAARPAQSSEARPAARPVQASEARPAARPVQASEARPAARPVQASDARPAARPAQGSEARPAARPMQSTDGRPAARPVQGNDGRPAARPAQSWDGRPAARPMQGTEARPDARPAARPQRPTITYDSRAQRQDQSAPVSAQPEKLPDISHSDDVQSRPASDGRIVATKRITTEERNALDPTLSPEIEQLDSGETKSGILEIIPESGFGFIRCDNFLPGDNDVYVSQAQIRKFNLKTGDIIEGNTKIRSAGEKFSALLYIKSVNGYHPAEATKRPRFEDLTPIFPNSRIHLETPGCSPAVRIVDLLSPIGKGQRGMIVSQPKAGKTTLLKQIASAITGKYPDIHLIILLIDERPEEVTDMKESINGSNVEVIYSTFDEEPGRHRRVSEMVIERAKRLVEHKQDVVILLDSITRLARAYNLTCESSGRTLSGGLDPAALHMPKKFFGAARNMREGGSLTIIATALVETGSRMDDVVFEEFKGTGNMELVLNRNLSERRIFPAIDLPKSGTRRDDLLLSPEEQEANMIIRRAFNSSKSDEAVERIINLFARTRSNAEFIEVVRKTRLTPPDNRN